MRRNCFKLVILLLAGSRLAAQSGGAHLVVAGGAASDLRGIRSAVLTVSPAITLGSSDFLLRLGASGNRFSNSAWSLGGTSSAALRVPLGRDLGLLLTASGEAVRASYRATYLWAEGLPSLEWRAGALSLWGGVRAAAARTSFAGSAAAFPLPGSSGVQSTSLLGPAFGGALTLPLGQGRGALGLRYREEHSQPAGLSVSDRTAGLSLRRGGLALEASVGFRRAPDERRGFGGARLSLALLPGVTLLGAAESYPSNRLTGTPGGRAVTAGLSFGVGGRRGPRPGPRAEGAPQPAAGLTRLTIAAPRAREVTVAGDWNAWRELPLTRSRNGVWYADLAIPPGSYRYAFRIDGQSWALPPGVAAVDDGFGGKSAWLTVGDSGRTARQSANRKEAP